MIELYEPKDIDAAYESWGANCGPCSLAAILKKDVTAVKNLFDGFSDRRYVNPTHMQNALKKTGTNFKTIKGFPTYGLVFLQVDGNWCSPGKPIAAAYRHTHWVGVAKINGLTFFYDVNIEGGQWVLKSWWEENVLPLIVSSKRGANGKYFLRTAFQINIT